VPAAAAARHRRQRLHPDQTIKPVRGEPLAIPLPFPGQTPANLAGIWPTRAGQPRQDHIAKKIFFPGSLLQKRNSNSKTLWLFLVNCVENHRKIKKI
jgi:hypothetical protein